MGQLATRIIGASDDFEVVASLGSSSDLSEMLGADIVLDVTLPAISPTVVDFAVSNGLNVLVGTSGWSRERISALESTLKTKPDAGVIIIPNFSVGSVLASSFAAIASRFFDSIEIIETHGAGKVDSPSGTAVRTAELIGAARADLGPVIGPHSDQRARGQQVSSVPIHSLRMQGAAARQDVVFGGDGEVLTLTHQALGHSAYEPGILLALRATAAARGVVVGLDKLIDLGGAPS